LRESRAAICYLSSLESLELDSEDDPELLDDELLLREDFSFLCFFLFLSFSMGDLDLDRDFRESLLLEDRDLRRLSLSDDFLSDLLRRSEARPASELSEPILSYQ
jgi:hypothetical protein